MGESRAIQAFQPKDLNDLKAVGSILAQSGFFADSREAAQAIAKILAGQEMGFGPFASMVGVYIVKGRPTYSANLIAAAIKRSGTYTYRVKRWDNQGCTIAFFERGEDIGESSFTLEDARVAELLAGPNAHSWKHYPKNMLFARAITNGARVFCPDVFGGIPVYTPEEMDVSVDAETGNVIEHDTSAGVSMHQVAKAIVEMETDGEMTVAPTGEMVQSVSGAPVDDLQDRTAPVSASAPQTVAPSAVVTDAPISSIHDPWWKRWTERVEEARAVGLTEIPNLQPPSEAQPIPKATIQSAAEALKKAIDSLDTQPATASDGGPTDAQLATIRGLRSQLRDTTEIMPLTHDAAEALIKDLNVRFRNQKAGVAS